MLHNWIYEAPPEKIEQWWKNTPYHKHRTARTLRAIARISKRKTKRKSR